MRWILRPFTPPWAFWRSTRASAAGMMPPYSAAAGPVSDLMSPIVMVLAPTPVALADAGLVATTVEVIIAAKPAVTNMPTVRLGNGGLGDRCQAVVGVEADS